MIENTVQHNFYSFFVKSIADLFKILIGSETGIYAHEIAGIITVSITFKHRRKIDSIASETCNMISPIDQSENTVFLNTVVFKRRTAQTERIYLIKYGFIPRI